MEKVGGSGEVGAEGLGPRQSWIEAPSISPLGEGEGQRSLLMD